MELFSLTVTRLSNFSDFGCCLSSFRQMKKISMSKMIWRFKWSSLLTKQAIGTDLDKVGAN